VSTSAISIQNLSKEFHVPFRREPLRAVKNLSLEVPAGEVYGLLGPNGSGKSTTMKILLGLVSPSEGASFIFNVNSRQVESRESVGFLPENPYFYKYLTGLETLLFFGKLCGLQGKTLQEKARLLLQTVGLTDAADRRLGGYSKGMLQRIGLAQALIGDPRLLVLDEPTAGVDPAGSYEIRDLILQFNPPTFNYLHIFFKRLFSTNL
jgi:ABC-2 type transport system ATP-binding protein